MEPKKIKEYITENFDQIPNELLREISQTIHDYHLDQASQEIQVLNLTEFTHEQLAQLGGVPVEIIRERSKRRENQDTASNYQLPRQIISDIIITALYTEKRQKRNFGLRCWFDETKQKWIKGMCITRKPKVYEKTTT